MAGDELLVGRYYRLASVQGALHQLFRWSQTTDQLNDDVGVGLKNRVEVVGPDYVAWHPRLLLAFDAPIADVRQAEQAIATLAENLGHGAAYGSEAHEGNTARGTTIRSTGCRIRPLMWRSFVQSLVSRMKFMFIIRCDFQLHEVENEERKRGRLPTE